MLTNILKILAKTRGDVFRINFPKNDEKQEKKAPIENLQVFGTFLHVDSQSVFRNGTFYTVV